MNPQAQHHWLTARCDRGRRVDTCLLVSLFHNDSGYAAAAGAEQTLVAAAQHLQSLAELVG